MRNPTLKLRNDKLIGSPPVESGSELRRRSAKPRMLIVTLFFAPEPIGISKYTGEMAQSLVEAGFEVRTVAAVPFYPQWALYPGYPQWRFSTEQIGQVKVIRCPLWVPPNASGFTRVLHLLSFALSSNLAVLAQLGWKPDHIFVIMPTMVYLPAVVVLSKLLNIHTWLHVQDFELDLAKDLNILPFAKWLTASLLLVENWFFAQFNKVSTISADMVKRLIKEKNVPAAKTTLLQNWVDADEIFPLRQASPFRKQLNIPAEKIVALYAGNMGRKYDLDLLADTAQNLSDHPEIEFVFCGDGVARPELEAACQNLKNVKFLPLQPEEQLNDLLNLADIHLLPQKAGAADSVMPSKLLGMLASGQPTIATVDPSSEVGRTLAECGMIVPPSDRSAFSEAVLTLAKNPSQRRTLGERSRAVAIQHFGKAAILDSFINELKQSAKVNETVPQFKQ